MDYRDNLYNVVLLLHILASIVGFGGVTLNGLYGAKAKAAGGPVGLGIARANFDVSMVAEYAIYSVPVFGILLIVLSDDVIEFSDAWISLSFLFYIVGLGISHGIVMRNAKKMQALMQELVDGGPPPAGSSGPPPQVAELERLGGQQALFGAILNVLLVVILYLMVFKPGG